MRKIILILLVFLVGCNVSQADIVEQVIQSIEAALLIDAPEVQNYKTPFYSYYLPPHVGVRQANRIGAVLVSHQEEIFLNIDIPTIIMRRHYLHDLENNMRALDLRQDIYTYSGKLETMKHDILDFEVLIGQEADRFTIVVHTSYFIVSACVPLALVKPILSDMITIVRFASADSSSIVKAYSRKQIIDYQQQVLEMFEQVAPEAGTLIDMDRLIKGEIDFSELEGYDLVPEQGDDEDQEQGE